MLDARLIETAALDELRARWRRDGTLRVAPFLSEAACRDVHAALAASPFTLVTAQPSELSFQYWAFPTVPEASCEHVMCRFGNWLWSEGAAFARSVTRLPLEPPADRMIVGTLYRRGCYLDPHNDFDGRRQVAFVLGLTATTWPAEEGGHLEFLATDEMGVSVVERWPPGWNTLDLFDVRAPNRLHAVPIVRCDPPRYAISGWFY